MKNLLFLFVFSLVSLTFSTTIFGPVQYERTTGPPNVYDTSFVAYDTTVACTLFVINGDEHGNHRLSAASIEFNGDEIISESDFNQHIGTIIRVISLSAENSFHLRLRSTPGAFLTLSVLRPCDAFVSLSVDTVIGDSACFSASAGGWGELNYSWDFDGDGIFDTTTSDSSICHTYTAPDTYWAKVFIENETGCATEDSGEVVVRFTFVPELIMEIDLDSILSVFPLYPGRSLEDAYLIISEKDDKLLGIVTHFDTSCTSDTVFKSLLLFYNGKFLGKYDDFSIAYIDTINYYILLYCLPPYYDGACLLDTMGNIIWINDIYLRKPKISTENNLLGSFYGYYGLHEGLMPPDPFDYEGGTNGARIFNFLTGESVDSLIASDFLSRNMCMGLFSRSLRNFYHLFYDSLVVYDRHFNRITTVSPIINFPARSELAFWTLPVFQQSSYDNNIYVYASYSIQPYPDYIPFKHPIETAFWAFMPDPYVTVEAVCLDTLGNILWRKTTDSLRVSVFAMSPSGKYTIGYAESQISYGYVAVWETQTNKLLFKGGYEQYTGSVDYHKYIWGYPPVEIFENKTTNHTLIRVNKYIDTLYLSINGLDVKPDFSKVDGLQFFDNHLSNMRKTINYAYKIEGNLVKVYKVRW